MTLAAWIDEHGLASDLLDEKYRSPGVISENQSHIRESFVNFLANLTRDEACHGLQKRGSNTGAIRSPDEVMQDPHPEDRAFWTDVDTPSLARHFYRSFRAIKDAGIPFGDGPRDKTNMRGPVISSGAKSETLSVYFGDPNGYRLEIITCP